MHKQPAPENPVERLMVSLLDGSPHGEWKTSLELLREARRVIFGLRARGYEIVRVHPVKRSQQ